MQSWPNKQRTKRGPMWTIWPDLLKARPTCGGIVPPKVAFVWRASPSSKPWSSSAGTGPHGSTASRCSSTSTSSFSKAKPTSSCSAVWAWGNPNQVTTPVGHRLSPEPAITVIDPRHPLCGRTLTLVAVTHHSELGRCCVVWLRPQVERLVPVRATNLEFDPNDISPSPLSLTTVEQLLRVFHDIEHASKGVNCDASPPLPSSATTRVRPPAGPPPALGIPVSEPATARAHSADQRRATVARSSATPSTT